MRRFLTIWTVDRFVSLLVTLQFVSLTMFSQPTEKPLKNLFNVSLNIKSGFGHFRFDSIKVPNSHTAADLQFGYLLRVTDKLNAGLGVGIAGYHSPVRNTIPIELKLRYSPLENERELGLEWDFGYAFLFGETFHEGFTSSLGIAWHPRLTRRRNFGILAGYTLQEIKNAELILISMSNVRRIYDNTKAHLFYFGLSYVIW